MAHTPEMVLIDFIRLVKLNHRVMFCLATLHFQLQRFHNFHPLLQSEFLNCLSFHNFFWKIYGPNENEQRVDNDGNNDSSNNVDNANDNTNNGISIKMITMTES